MAKTDDEQIDIYKETPLRYLGYANEAGEAFRPFIGPRWVRFSYAVATAYVIADTVDKTAKTYNKHNKCEVTPKGLKKTLYTAFDTLTWQMLASVIIPGFAINRACAATNYLLYNKIIAVPCNIRKYIVTAVGLAAIPFIIKPIDHLVDDVMDCTIRKAAP